MQWQDILVEFNTALSRLSFATPVAYIYNPLEYASKAHLDYCRRYGQAPKEIVLVGMNPGPWGMAQTGVPFGEIGLVKDWLGIETAVGRPARMHPKRPVDGFDCKRSEVSGKRLWGWARECFGDPQNFFARFFVLNYCPLMFIEDSGRNRTPDKLPVGERKPLLSICDGALTRSISVLKPRYVFGIGRFAGARVSEVLAGKAIKTGTLTHPSPANPKANQGWGSLIEAELSQLGIDLGA
jgi:single-strand selective monofunctional uracil DNA glycosylase